jgi:VIT1/CCC1 family predicted Fe2+/Mn2+ transporter
VILGGLAELFAGSISMGLGAYLAALTDRKHYDVELERERRQVLNSADQEDKAMYRLFADYGLGREVVEPLARQLRGDPGMWVKVCASMLWLVTFVMWRCS